MNVVDALDAARIPLGLTEISNNLVTGKNRKGSQVSVSSASSCQSDSSEENHGCLERKSSLQDLMQKAEDKQIRSEYKRCRSLSDGAATARTDDPLFEVFPSLPNSVLEKMGLLEDGPRERFNEEELEQKFTSLALAFTIDAATIKDRHERQRRYRDQTEINLSREIERLKEKLALIRPLCIDYETVELLSALLTQVEKIINATAFVAISAERYGSVQHEDRLTESVHVMVSHVQKLKQQRDSARRQLQYTKRVLQNPVHDSPGSSPTNTQKLSLPVPNRKVICRRRASIATFSQTLLESKPTIDKKKITRRTSDLSIRASSLSRNIRPNRLELGGDLVKIKEGCTYEAIINPEVDLHEDIEYESEPNFIESAISNHSSPPENPHISEETPVDFKTLSFREKVRYKFGSIRNHIEEKYQKWTDDGTIHEVCCFCALLCFSISIITMANILVEYEYAKRGRGTSFILWTWSDTYDDRKHNSIIN